jgi:hypothetical protein
MVVATTMVAASGARMLRSRREDRPEGCLLDVRTEACRQGASPRGAEIEMRRGTLRLEIFKRKSGIKAHQGEVL